MHVHHLPETKKELKNLRWQEIQILCTEKACFQHDMAYGQSKDLTKSTQSDKVLKDNPFKIASDPKYDG